MREARPKGARRLPAGLSLQCSLPDLHADLHAGALGRGEPAAPAGGTCAAHVPSHGGSAGPRTSGCGSSGRAAGHLGRSAMEDGEGALPGCGPTRRKQLRTSAAWPRDPRRSPEAEAVRV